VPLGSGTRIGIDRDEDALLDGVETNTGIFLGPSDTGSDPTLADTDGDGFDDGVEVAAGTDPTDPLDFPSFGPQLPALGSWGVRVLVALLSVLGVLGIARLRRSTG
jgi:hypothetical protein